jgi:trimethylamine:corrinoid methyltransferase-like protein
MEERASRQVDKILESHNPAPLPPEVQRDIRRVVVRQQEWIDSTG